MFLSSSVKQLMFKGKACCFCGQPAQSVDHLIPKSQGGKNSLDNMIPACKPCNSAKGSMALQDFIAPMSADQQAKCTGKIANALASNQANKQAIMSQSKLAAAKFLGPKK